MLSLVFSVGCDLSTTMDYDQDVDFSALMRLAILHDTPIACSPAAADLFVATMKRGES